MKKTIIIMFIILSLIFISCAKKQSEEVIKPENDMVVVEEQPTEEFEVVEEPIEEDTLLIEDNNTMETVTVEYKVQLFATYDEMKANKVANDLKPLFVDEVYVEYIAPYYKVRVGHYKTKEEAERVRDEARMKGYSDAFVVVP